MHLISTVWQLKQINHWFDDLSLPQGDEEQIKLK